MSTADLELELKRQREPGTAVPPSNALALSVEEALAYRDAGNLPDQHDRSLRLVLVVNDPAELSYLQEKRLEYEPDFHDAPAWRREGSRPVNVVPLRTDPGGRGSPMVEGWWNDPELARMEDEWSRTGRVAGMSVPAEYRSFIYKTVLSLRAAHKEVSAEAVLASIARWLPPRDVQRIALALRKEW